MPSCARHESKPSGDHQPARSWPSKIGSPCGSTSRSSVMPASPPAIDNPKPKRRSAATFTEPTVWPSSVERERVARAAQLGRVPGIFARRDVAAGKHCLPFVGDRDRLVSAGQRNGQARAGRHVGQVENKRAVLSDGPAKREREVSHRPARQERRRLARALKHPFRNLPAARRDSVFPAHQRVGTQQIDAGLIGSQCSQRQQKREQKESAETPVSHFGFVSLVRKQNHLQITPISYAAEPQPKRNRPVRAAGVQPRVKRPLPLCASAVPSPVLPKNPKTHRVIRASIRGRDRCRSKSSKPITA